MFRAAIRALIFFLLVPLFISCSDKQQAGNPEGQVSEQDEGDMPLTKEEIFSASLVQGIMGEEDDPDLEQYIEQSLFAELSGSKAVTMDRLSSSMYLVEYEQGGQMKRFIIRKYYFPAGDEYKFERLPFEGDFMKALGIGG